MQCNDENEPLLSREPPSTGWEFIRNKKLLVSLAVLLGLILIGTTLGVVLQFYLFPRIPDIPDAKDEIDFTLLTLR